jgi:hypothetical protein
MMAHVMMASMVCVAMYPVEVHNYCLCISQEVHFYTRLSSPLSNWRMNHIVLYTFEPEGLMLLKYMVLVDENFVSEEVN